MKQNGPFQFSYISAHYKVSCFFLSLLPDMVRSQTHSHTTKLKTDNITASSRSSINTAAVFQAMSQQAQKLFGFMKCGANSIIKNIKDTQKNSSVEHMK